MKVDLWPVGETPPPTATPSRWRRFVERHLPSVVIYLMVATLVAVVLYPHMVITVPSGQVGVLWKRFGGGTVLDPRKLKNEGFNLILPWNRVFLSEAAILYGALQRHLQRRREPDCNSHRPVSVAARCGARVAPSDRAKLRASTGAAGDIARLILAGGLWLASDWFGL
jgi:hypothetical protein